MDRGGWMRWVDIKPYVTDPAVVLAFLAMCLSVGNLILLLV